MFRRVELAARRRWTELGELDGDAGWTGRAAGRRPSSPTSTSTPDPDRGGRPRAGAVDHRRAAGPGVWTVRQIIDDPAGDHDWGITARIDLARSDAEGTAVVQVIDVGQLGVW